MDIRTLMLQIKNFYEGLNKKQKYVILGSIVALIMFLSFLLVFNTKTTKIGATPGFTVLFDGLSAKDSALIIQQMQQSKIPYEVGSNGSIAIPQERVYEERVRLASLGIPKDNKVGFEIFDQKDFGATDFDQKVKLTRAMEGELSRTIEGLTPIKKATVIIAIPKETVFAEKKTLPTASVSLLMEANMVLSTSQIQGIKNLVASSISNLTPENVSLVNENGESLGNVDDVMASRELVSAQNKYKQLFEKQLEDKIINILSPLTGGQSGIVAKVTAEFDFSQKQTTQEIFDPNNVIRSEQSLEEKREGFRPKEIGGVPGAVSNIGPVQGLEDQNLKEKYEKTEGTTNYEVGKTVSSTKGQFATVQRLTAAVVVDGRYNNIEVNGTEILSYIARNDNEMLQINNLVKQAIGYNQDRGDAVTVSNFELNAKTTQFKAKTIFEKSAENINIVMSSFTPMLKYLVVFIILVIFYKKVIAPFGERMLRDAEDDEDIESMLKFEDDDDNDESDTAREMRKKVEDQLNFGKGVNEEEIKYDILLEKLREVVAEKPEDIASLFESLIQDEMMNGGMKMEEEKPK